MNPIDYESLIETRKRLIYEVSSLSQAEFNQKPDPESWSIAQVCQHLTLVEKLFTSAIQYGLRNENGQTAKPKAIHSIKDRTMKVKAPEMSLPGDGPFELTQILELFAESRETLYGVLNHIEDPAVLAERSAKHPVFGRLPLNQWVELLYLHEQRHIEQIREIKGRLD